MRFEVAALSLDGAVLEGLEIGDDGPRARRVEATFDLLAQRIQTLTIEGLQAAVVQGSDGTPIVRGLTLPQAGGTGPADVETPPSLPVTDLTLADLIVTVETPAGPHRLEGSASLRGPRPDEGQGLFPLALEIALQDAAGGGRVDLALAVDADGIAATGAADLALAAWAPLIPGLQDATGRLSATLDLNGPPADAVPATLREALARVAGLVELTPQAVRLTLPSIGAVTLSDAPVTVRAGDGGLSLALPGAFEAALAAPPPALHAALRAGAPAAARAPLRLRPATPTDLTLNLHPHDGGWEIAATEYVHLVNGPISATIRPHAVIDADGGMTLPIAAGTRLEIDPTALAQGARLRRPAAFTVRDDGRITLPADGAVTADLALALRDLALTLPDGEMVDLFLPDLRPRIAGAGVSLAFTGAALHWADADLTATQMEGWIEGRAGGPYTLSLNAPEIVQAGAPLLSGASAFDGALSPDGAGGWRVEGTLSKADGQIETTLSAALLSDGAPRLAFETAPIRYRPDGLQPGALSPLVEGLFQEAEGALSLTGDARLTPDGLAGRAEVRLDALGFRSGLARVQALSGVVAFDLARAPATEDGQRLSARIAVAGLPAARFALTFALDSQARLLIDRLAVETLGGEIVVREASFDPLDDSFFGWVDLSGLSLDQALASLDVEGLDGDGALSGTFPLTVEAAKDGGPPRVTVASGRVAAEGPGVLRIDNAAVNDYLGGRNQAVDMMVEALKDFRYDRLSADLDIRPDGAGELKLSIFGRNPAVLQGQPFDLNIAVETDFAKLFETLADAFSTTDTLLERLAQRAR
ncbi:MAG: YdbH domain-containing protein [Marivibrio sp.]|uniref:intermembrane phospholipid transport protein YdbH family protein n=1 Tax=Marivibrio sp. TaxID=2039719 RepID=UPI0032EBE3D2